MNSSSKRNYTIVAFVGSTFIWWGFWALVSLIPNPLSWGSVERFLFLTSLMCAWAGISYVSYESFAPERREAKHKMQSQILKSQGKDAEFHKSEYARLTGRPLRAYDY